MCWLTQLNDQGYDVTLKGDVGYVYGMFDKVVDSCDDEESTYINLENVTLVIVLTLWKIKPCLK